MSAAPERPYTGVVPTIVVVLMACLLGAVTVGDRVACPDGCTNDAVGHRAESSAPSACALCHGWSGPTPAVVAGPVLGVSTLLPLFDERHYAAYLPPIDHPPRAVHGAAH